MQVIFIRNHRTCCTLLSFSWQADFWLLSLICSCGWFRPILEPLLNNACRHFLVLVWRLLRYGPMAAGCSWLIWSSGSFGTATFQCGTVTSPIAQINYIHITVQLFLLLGYGVCTESRFNSQSHPYLLTLHQLKGAMVSLGELLRLRISHRECFISSQSPGVLLLRVCSLCGLFTLPSHSPVCTSTSNTS